jgi:hypothetical protein
MKRTFSWGDIAFTVFLGVFVMAMIVAALGYKTKARAIPLLVGSFTLVMIITSVLSELNPKIKSKFDVGLIDYSKMDRLMKGDQPSTKLSGLELWKKIIATFGWTAGALVAIYLLGFHIAISLFSILFLRFYGSVTWLRSIVLTAFLCGSVYLFFVVLLAVDLYEGILFGALPPSF